MLEIMVEASEFEPLASWSRRLVARRINDLAGVCYMTGGPCSGLITWRLNQGPWLCCTFGLVRGVGTILGTVFSRNRVPSKYRARVDHPPACSNC
jgi:hypothetical protein